MIEFRVSHNNQHLILGQCISTACTFPNLKISGDYAIGKQYKFILFDQRSGTTHFLHSLSFIQNKFDFIVQSSFLSQF